MAHMESCIHLLIYHAIEAMLPTLIRLTAWVWLIIFRIATPGCCCGGDSDNWTCVGRPKKLTATLTCRPAVVDWCCRARMRSDYGQHGLDHDHGLGLGHCYHLHDPAPLPSSGWSRQGKQSCSLLSLLLGIHRLGNHNTCRGWCLLLTN